MRTIVGFILSLTLIQCDTSFAFSILGWNLRLPCKTAKLVELASTTTGNAGSGDANAPVQPTAGFKRFPSSEIDSDWLVYIDQSKASLERGGVATLDAFVGLAPTGKVIVKAAMFSKPPKGKGPYIRCIPIKARGFSTFEVSNVNSVEKVYRVLTKHMKLSGITVQMCDCLKLKYKGNGYLEAKQVPLAIEAYDRGLEMGVPSQKGVLLFMRAAAHAALAASRRQILQIMVKELTDRVPTKSTLRSLYGLGAAHYYDKSTPRSSSSALSNAIMRKVLQDTRQQEKQMRKIQYWHGLYQHAMLKALEDALGATELLDDYAPAWERAASIFSDLWRLDESLECYDIAQRLDPSLELEPALLLVRKRQQLVADAQSFENWAEDPLRLALDIKG